MTNNSKALNGNEEFYKYCKELEADIQNAYTSAVATEEAELLAAKFLRAMIVVGRAVSDADLDTRMRKTGLKAIKAAVYLQEATKGDKKPSDVMLEALVNKATLVVDSQEAFDRAEVYKNELENYLSVAREAHVYFRGVAKGRFE